MGVTFDTDWYLNLSDGGRRRVDDWVDANCLRYLTSVTLLDESGCFGRLTVVDLDASIEAREIVEYVIPSIRWETPFPVDAR